MKTVLFIVIIVSGVLAVACGDEATSTPAPTATPRSSPEAEAATSPSQPTKSAQAGKKLASDIKNVKLEDLTIEVGTTVVWTQRDNNVHTTTSGTPENPTGLWDSDPMRKGDTFEHTFTQAGTFPYFCEIHGSIMTATVTVVEG